MTWSISYNHHGCWWPGSLCHQDIDRYGNDFIVLEHSVAHLARVSYHHVKKCDVLHENIRETCFSYTFLYKNIQFNITLWYIQVYFPHTTIEKILEKNHKSYEKKLFSTYISGKYSGKKSVKSKVSLRYCLKHQTYDRQVSRAWISNHIPQHSMGCNSYPCCRSLPHKSSVAINSLFA